MGDSICRFHPLVFQYLFERKKSWVVTTLGTITYSPWMVAGKMIFLFLLVGYVTSQEGSDFYLKTTKDNHLCFRAREDHPDKYHSSRLVMHHTFSEPFWPFFWDAGTFNVGSRCLTTESDKKQLIRYLSPRVIQKNHLNHFHYTVFFGKDSCQPQP